MIPSLSILKKRAKTMVRDTDLSHSAALDRIATEYGFQGWSHLVAATPRGQAAQIYAAIVPGDMVLLAARPGHGKTRLSLELAIAAHKAAPAIFFTLDYGPEQVAAQLDALGCSDEACPLIDTSDCIASDHILQEVARVDARFVVVDYLQVLDQRRSNPPVEDQLAALASFAQRTDVAFCVLSQVDRRFDTADTAMPGLSDIRQPNPFSLGHFTKACFLHRGSFRLEHL